MVAPGWLASIPVVLAFAALCCLFRLFSLRLASVYPSLCYFLLFQIALVAASIATGLKSDAYEVVYIALLLPEWLVYGFMMREIYASIFSDYPGIAVLGRWSVYGALAATGLILAFSVGVWRSLFTGQQSILPLVETVAHCFTFGFALLILIILAAISRYPLILHKNVLINATLFGAILLGEASGLIADQVVWRKHTAWINLAVNLNTTICLLLWPLLLSREGQTRVLRLRRHVDPEDENRLLGQLSAISSIIMGTARK